jgi:similar to stage IV sporulation protein
MRILLSEEFQLFCKELEEKKIEILQKDVKIYLQENSAKAKGTLRIQEKIGQHNETEMIDF